MGDGISRQSCATCIAIHAQKSFRRLDIRVVGKNIGISRAGLANKFKEVLNIPPMEYLTRIRMDKARDLFMKEDTNLEEVALAVGYSSAFAFSKAYKRLFGVSPAREWKKTG